MRNRAKDEETHEEDIMVFGDARKKIKLKERINESLKKTLNYVQMRERERERD